jgi:acyl-CoA thioesterase-1
MDTFRHARALAAIATATLFAAASGFAGGAATAATTSPPLSVLTIGDSIMNGFGLPAGQDWPTLLASANGWSVTNAACDGAGVIQVGNANECDSNFAGIIDAEASQQPDIVIFQGSSNDFGESNSALLAATIAELQTIRADFPSAQIVGLSTLWGYTDTPAQLDQINAQVQQAVEAVGGTYVDLGQPFSGRPDLMQASDVHPTAAGQAIIASEVQTALTPVLAAVAKADVEAGGVARLGNLDRLHTGE